MAPEAVKVVAAAICSAHRVLIAQRSAAMSLPLKWELPGGKIRPDEEPKKALRREIREELGIEIDVGRFLGRGQSSETGRLVVLDVYLARAWTHDLLCREHAQLRWVTADELGGFDWAAADRPVLSKLAAVLRSARSPSSRAPLDKNQH